MPYCAGGQRGHVPGGTLSLPHRGRIEGQHSAAVRPHNRRLHAHAAGAQVLACLTLQGHRCSHDFTHTLQGRRCLHAFTHMLQGHRCLLAFTHTLQGHRCLHASLAYRRSTGKPWWGRWPDSPDKRLARPCACPLCQLNPETPPLCQLSPVTPTPLCELNPVTPPLCELNPAPPPLCKLNPGPPTCVS